PIMVRLESSLVLLVEAALAKALDKVEATWDPRPTVGVVLAAGGDHLAILQRGAGVEHLAVQQQAYRLAEKIRWNGCFYRKDIGYRAIARERGES
ncbi:phosphoribosylamine--glycine ligase, partial [Pseudomonas aeruginosa]